MTITHADLAHFTGTATWFRHSLMRDILYTEGVLYLAEQAQCYWLIDKIAVMQLAGKIRAEPFQVWTLVKDKNNAAYLSCTDGGDDDKVLHFEEITFTDFPLDRIEIWVEGNVILLPSEH